MSIPRAMTTYMTALSLIAVSMGSGAFADSPERQPGFGPFSAFEFDPETSIYKLVDTEIPFLGNALEPLGTFEIKKVTAKQETRAFFRGKVTNHGDICRRNRESLHENEQRTAERSCGARVWAYRSEGQIFFFKADRDTVLREGKLKVSTLGSTSWNRSIDLRQAQEDITGSHVMRAFSVPRSEIRRHSDLRSAARSNEIYAFSGASEPGEVISTEARAFAWNAGLIIFGATLNPLYIVKVPKHPSAPTSIRITEKESVSVLLMGNSTFTTDYHLTKIDAESSERI